MRAQGMIFDLDGTLVDTEELWDVVRRRLAADDGVPWPEGASQAMMGRNTQQWSTYLSEVVGLRGDPETCAQRTIDALAEHYHTYGLPALPGAADAVRRMAELFPLGVASSSPQRLIDIIVTELGVADCFRTTVSSETCADGKPAPDVYLKACEEVGIDPRASLAVEDAANGIRAALAAGMGVIVVPTEFHPPSPDLVSEACAVIGSLDDLTAALVATL